MLFLSWNRPSSQQQKACIEKSGVYNYDSKYRGASSSSSRKKQLSDDGFFVNEARILLGSGLPTFNLAKTALLNWRHFGLNWAFVDPKTPIKTGTEFCVCAKELLPWFMMPLQINYVDENTNSGGAADSKLRKASCGFGSGTLHGHLLAGEERFSVELDEENRVWYEIFSFSKPAHFLSAIAYPYVQLRQKLFAQQSMQSVLKHVKDAQESSL